MLRSCYATKMNFGTDPANAQNVQWYWCEPTAKDLGIPSPFVSRNWIHPDPYPLLGEVAGEPRTYRKGDFPIIVPGTAGPCGQRRVFEQGSPVASPPGLPRNAFGLALCCGSQIDLAGQPLFVFYPDASIFAPLGPQYFGDDFFGPNYFGDDYYR